MLWPPLCAGSAGGILLPRQKRGSPAQRNAGAHGSLADSAAGQQRAARVDYNVVIAALTENTEWAEALFGLISCWRMRLCGRSAADSAAPGSGPL